MGTFATLNGDRFTKCPKCNKLGAWQSKGLWLTYKAREFWIGDYEDIELDKNMNGHIVAYGYPKEMKFKDGSSGCGHNTYYKIIKGKLIESTEKEYKNGTQ